MLAAQNLLAYRQRPLDQRLGLGIAALDLPDLAEIVQERRHRGMLRTGGLFVDRQRPFEQRFGIAVAAELLVMRRQIVQGLPELRMTAPQGFFADRQRALEQRLGVGIAFLPLVQRRQIVQGRGDLGRVETGRLLEDRDGSLEQRLGFAVPALIAVGLRQIVQRCADVAMRGPEFFLEAFDLCLRQRDGFRVFAGAAEFVDLGAERGDIAFLRERRRGKARARQQGKAQRKYQSIAGFHAGLRWSPLRGHALGRANVHPHSNPRSVTAALTLVSPLPLLAHCPCQPWARASPASRTSILRNAMALVTRSGKSSRNVALPACMSMPSGSQPVQRQSADSAPSNLVA